VNGSGHGLHQDVDGDDFVGHRCVQLMDSMFEEMIKSNNAGTGATEDGIIWNLSCGCILRYLPARIGISERYSLFITEQ